MAAITSAVVGVVGAGVSIGMSVSQANKAASDRRKAQKQAEKALEEAKRETEIMPMQELSLNLAAYEQSREAQQRGIQQVMSQAELDPRQAAAVGGRAMMAGIEAERGIRAAQAKETLDLEKIKATERAEASKAREKLALGEAEGAQAAAADAAGRQRQAQQAAIAAGIEGFGQVADLYSAVQGDFDPENLNMQSQAPPMPSGVSGVQQALQGSNLNSSQGPIQYTDPNTGEVIYLDPSGLQLNGRI